MAQTPERADVVIAGGGFAGLALGMALRQGLGSAFAIIVADPFIGRDGSGDPRASAIAAGARRLFETIGVWEAVAQEAQPILDMAVTDSRLTDKMRPVFLSFGGEVEPGEPFAHMIENRDLVAALTVKARELGIGLQSAAVTGFEAGSGHIAVRFPDGARTAARLLGAADGARSRLRELAGIPTYGWNYPQSAIVTNVAHERDHGGGAREHFLSARAFARLPLPRRRCSIVWTEEAGAAERIVALPDDVFHAELERRFGLELGEIEVISPGRVTPCGYSVARSFIGERLALIGDAAHVIHPIAGQALNMGLRDVAALAEAIVD